MKDTFYTKIIDMLENMTEAITNITTTTIENANKGSVLLDDNSVATFSLSCDAGGIYIVTPDGNEGVAE